MNTTQTNMFDNIRSLESFVFINTNDNRGNFALFQVGDSQITSEPLSELHQKIGALTIPFIQKFRSMTWSSNCRWFFLTTDLGIYLFNVYEDEYWFSPICSIKFVELFV